MFWSGKKMVDYNIKNFNDKVRLYSIGYVSIFSTAPIMAYGNIYRILAIIAVVLWVTAELADSKSVLRKPNLHILMLYIYLLYTTFINIVFTGYQSLIENIQLYIMFFFILVYISYSRKSIETLKPVIYLQIVLITLWLITTSIGLIEHPRAARALIRSSSIAVEYSNSGIGGFGFINAVIVYGTMMLALFLHHVKTIKIINIKVLFFLSSFLLSFFVVLKSNYSISLLLFIAVNSLLLFLLMNKIIKIMVIIFFSIILLFMQSYVSEIMDLLLELSSGTNYHLKLNDLISSVNSTEVTGTAFDRIDRYIRSIVIFFENPVFGILVRDSIGKHSLILDTFAQFGFIIGVLLIYILLKIPYSIYRISKKQQPLSAAILFAVIALLSLNNIAMSYGFMFYILYLYIIKRTEYA
jgi:hypothetical protein